MKKKKKRIEIESYDEDNVVLFTREQIGRIIANLKKIKDLTYVTSDTMQTTPEFYDACFREFKKILLDPEIFDGLNFYQTHYFEDLCQDISLLLAGEFSCFEETMSYQSTFGQT
jgi:translation elongation factor EF-4